MFASIPKQLEGVTENPKYCVGSITAEVLNPE
jgi:hypothetical protein